MGGEEGRGVVSLSCTSDQMQSVAANAAAGLSVGRWRAELIGPSGTDCDTCAELISAAGAVFFCFCFFSLFV